MATLDFKQLRKEYDNFLIPVAAVRINGKELPNEKVKFQVADYDIDLTSGFEASMASFSIYNTYDVNSGSFDTENVKKYICLGSKVEIFLGYGEKAKLVFVGLIAKVSYQFYAEDIPCIRITAMDAKSVMMAGNYSRQLKASTFTEAVKEIFERSAYVKLKSDGIINSVNISSSGISSLSGNTGTGGNKASTIEMVAESDYEFIVKLAKKNNYDFFIDAGNVIFRKAKENTTPLIAIHPSMGVQQFDIEYDITGIAETIYTRSTDASKGEVIQANAKFSNKISLGNKAKNLIKGSERVYIDPTVTSKEEAQSRVDSLMEDMAYRYGTLTMDIIGIPDLKPGYYIDILGMGDGPSNIFYITNVQHLARGEGKYITRVTGKSNALPG